MNLTMPGTAERLLNDVSRETMDRLEAYEELLRKWSPRINLVSRNDIGDLRGRHVIDSAQLLKLAPTNVTTWLDIGSGGGFPGLVIAVLAADTNATLCVTLVESDQRKAAFLRTVCQELRLNAKVLSSRVEALQPLNAGVISARALAPLGKLLHYAAPHLADGGICLFPKGVRFQEELADARAEWRFSCDVIESVTQAGAVILRISNPSRITESG